MSELNTAATNIYNRLLSAPTFHPASADLFTDWNMQAGDVVTVKSDSDSYQVPIYNMKLKWTGAPKVEVESTGNPEREPLPAIKRREYSANSSNYKEQKSLRGGVGQAQSGVREINGVLYAAGLQIDPVTGVWLYASEHGADYALGSSFKVQSDKITAEVTRATTAEGTMSSRITQTADAITAEVTRATAAETEAYSRITQTADAITAEVARATNAETEAYSRITQTADAITAEVTRATTEEGTLSSRITQTADQIALKVSKGNVATQLAVECGNVTISGGDLKVSGYITSQGLITSMGQFNGSIYASGSIGTPGSMSAKRITLDGESLTSHVLSFIGNLYTVAADSDINLAHYHAISASESNGVITITQGAAQSTAGTATFNIADTQFYKDAVRSAKNEGIRSVKIKANDIILDPTGTPTYYSSSKKYSVPVYAEATNGESNTNGIMIDASDAWNAGKNSVTLSDTGWTQYATRTITASNGQSVIVSVPNVTVSGGSWSNGKMTVSAYYGSSGVLGSTEVALPSSASWSISYTAEGETVSCTIGGKTYTHKFTN